MTKISINYYLNDKLKSKEKDGQTVFPLYIRIIHKRILSRVKSVFTPIPITKELFEWERFESLVCKDETKFIQSFFDFAESAITDFNVSKSKTNLGKLLEFWHNDLYLALYDYGFIDTDTRAKIHTNLAMYLSEKTGLSFGAMILFIKDFRENSVTHFLPLCLELKKLKKEKVLTDKQAAKIEFINLLREYKTKGKVKDYKAKIYDFFTEKETILQYVSKKSKFCTPEMIKEFADETETLFKDTVRHFYSKFHYTTDTIKNDMKEKLQNIFGNNPEINKYIELFLEENKNVNN
jgi:hypothetical protein